MKLNKKYLYIGAGVAVAGVLAYFLFRKKESSGAISGLGNTLLNPGCINCTKQRAIQAEVDRLMPNVPFIRDAAAATTAPPMLPTLSNGSDLRVQGQVKDTYGRPVDATVTVYRDATPVGASETTASYFSVYDIPPGDYVLKARSRSGAQVERTVRVSAYTSRVNFVLDTTESA